MHDTHAKKEGAFYVWSAMEIKSLLNKEVSDENHVKLSDIFCRHFNVNESGNVKSHQVCYILFLISIINFYSMSKYIIDNLLLIRIHMERWDKKMY